MLAGFSRTPIALRLRADAIRRSLVRSDLGEMKLRRDLIRTLVPQVELRSPGGVILGYAPAIRFDRDRVYPLLKKIVRGLHRHHVGTFLAVGARFSWGINERPVGLLEAAYAQSASGRSDPGVFECRFCAGENDDGEMAVWWLRFYEGVIFRCVVDSRTPPGDLD